MGSFRKVEQTTTFEGHCRVKKKRRAENNASRLLPVKNDNTKIQRTKTAKIVTPCHHIHKQPKDTCRKTTIYYSMDKRTFKLLTFNTWGLKFVSKNRKERLRAIADELSLAMYDIVALQEVWVEEDWLYLDQVCQTAYPYRRRFMSGILAGPGLVVLLKLPIQSTFLYRFPINGRPSAFFRGDWFVGKSLAVTVLEEPDGRQIALLNSHMHAPYSASGDAAYSTHRACQAWDLAKVVRLLQKAGYAVIQVGDLNSKPGSLPYRLFTAEGNLRDSWDVLHGEDVLLAEELAMMDPAEQITKGGVTCDSRLNTWRATRKPWEATRLDYALIDHCRIRPVLAAVEFTHLLPPPLQCSHSDHFGYSLEFTVVDLDTGSHDSEVDESSLRLDVYRELEIEIRHYLAHTIPRQANWRKLHFLLSIFLVVVINVAIAFAANVQPWSSVLLCVGSTVIGITGVVNGMIWGLGVRSELRALQEVKKEVEDAERALKRLVDI